MLARKVCVVTGSRAEYGLLYWLLRAINEDPDLDLQLAVCGSHMVSVAGGTADAVAQDGFPIAAEVEMVLASDSACAVSKSLALGLISFADHFARLVPDWVVLLGDRYETLSAGIAAHNARIPIAHIAGGEASYGATDEAMRHCLTKLGTIHFPAGPIQRERVLQLGEHPDRVFAFGKPGLDNLARLTLLSRREVFETLGLDECRGLFLTTFHPVTLATDSGVEQVTELLAALDEFPSHNVVVTSPNVDAGGRDSSGPVRAVGGGTVRQSSVLSESRATLVPKLCESGGRRCGKFV